MATHLQCVYDVYMLYTSIIKQYLVIWLMHLVIYYKFTYMFTWNFYTCYKHFWKVSSRWLNKCIRVVLQCNCLSKRFASLNLDLREKRSAQCLWYKYLWWMWKKEKGSRRCDRSLTIKRRSLRRHINTIRGSLVHLCVVFYDALPLRWLNKRRLCTLINRQN